MWLMRSASIMCLQICIRQTVRTGGFTREPGLFQKSAFRAEKLRIIREQGRLQKPAGRVFLSKNESLSAFSGFNDELHGAPPLKFIDFRAVRQAYLGRQRCVSAEKNRVKAHVAEFEQNL